MHLQLHLQRYLSCILDLTRVYVETKLEHEIFGIDCYDSPQY